jgi:hypothetical protein
VPVHAVFGSRQSSQFTNRLLWFFVKHAMPMSSANGNSPLGGTCPSDLVQKKLIWRQEMKQGHLTTTNPLGHRLLQNSVGGCQGRWNAKAILTKWYQRYVYLCVYN